MVPAIRKAFNEAFTEEKYQQYIHLLDAAHPGEIEFRVAETPIFCDKAFTDKMIAACESIVDIIISPDFKEHSRRAIPPTITVPNENEHTQFIAFDFGICESETNGLEPRLVEMQGFPTLFAFEVLQTEIANKMFDIPANYSTYLGGFNKETYLQLLKEIIIGNHPTENVVLLEVLPHLQKTRIDFYCTREYLGIETVDLVDLIREGRKLYYLKDGVKTEIRRIYNRLIFDDLQQQLIEIQEKGTLLYEDLDVEWVPHPN